MNGGTTVWSAGGGGWATWPGRTTGSVGRAALVLVFPFCGAGNVEKIGGRAAPGCCGTAPGRPGAFGS